MAKQKAHQAGDRRPGGYPFNSYSVCVELLQALRQCGGASGAVPKSVLASALGLADSSSNFYSRIASAKTFGMVDGNRDVSMTPAARDYVLPESDAQRRLAELTFFEAPTAFRFLIERFDGHELLAPPRIADILHKSNIAPETWAQRVASFFVSMAEELRIIDRGFLRLSVARHEATTGRQGPPPRTGTAPDTEREHLPPAPVRQPPMIREGSSSACTNWEHGGVVLVTPDPLAHEVWTKLLKYVQMLEPEKPTGGPTNGST